VTTLTIPTTFDPPNIQSPAASPGPNLLTNGGFEIWQRGTSFAAMANSAYACDRWAFSKGGTSALTVTQEATIVDPASRYSAKLVYTHNVQSFFFQKLEDFYQLRGLTLTLSVRVRSNTANAVRLFLQDNTGTGTASAFHTGDSTWQTLSCTKVIDGAATFVQALISLEASATIYLDNAMLVIGALPAVYLPLRPADDWARCRRYYEVLGGSDVFEALGRAMCISTTQALGSIIFTPKAIVPTITFGAAANYAVDNAAGTVIACTAMLAQRPALSSAQFTVTVASGLVAGNGTQLRSNNTLAGTVAIEANI
jgi:hypothetical protein